MTRSWLIFHIVLYQEPRTWFSRVAVVGREPLKLVAVVVSAHLAIWCYPLHQGAEQISSKALRLAVTTSQVRSLVVPQPPGSTAPHCPAADTTSQQALLQMLSPSAEVCHQEGRGLRMGWGGGEEVGPGSTSRLSF